MTVCRLRATLCAVYSRTVLSVNSDGDGDSDGDGSAQQRDVSDSPPQSVLLP